MGCIAMARVRPTAEERARRMSLRNHSVQRVEGDRLEGFDARWSVVDPRRLVEVWNPAEFLHDGMYVVNGHKVLVIRAKHGSGTYLVGVDNTLTTESGLLALGDTLVDGIDYETCGNTFVCAEAGGFAGAVRMDTDTMVAEDDSDADTEIYDSLSASSPVSPS